MGCKPLVGARVLHHERRILKYRVGAKRQLARDLSARHPEAADNDLMRFTDHANRSHGRPANLRGQSGQIIDLRLRSSAQRIVAMQRE
jgi:hypothetical protein